MINRINLDDENFEQIVERAKSKIKDLAPQWTDWNRHDPGIMMIELFAWLTEMMNFYINQSVSVEVFFPILGITPLESKAASAWAQIDLPDYMESHLYLPRGTPVVAKEIVFEVQKTTFFKNCDIVAVSTKDGIWEAEHMTLLHPFGERPSKDDVFSLWIGGGYRAGATYSIAVTVLPCARNPIDIANPPHISEIKWEYASGNEYKPLEVIDETYGFLQDGIIYFSAEKGMRMNKSGLFEIRATLKAYVYDSPPAIKNIYLSALNLKQVRTIVEDVECKERWLCYDVDTYLAKVGETVVLKEDFDGYRRVNIVSKTASDYVPVEFVIEDSHIGSTSSLHFISCKNKADLIIGIADGCPNQKFTIPLQNETIIELSILLSKDHELTYAQKWTQTYNLSCSSPHSRHYLLNEKTGEILFGDGIHGAIPDGVIMIASMRLTKSEEGNIAANQLDEVNVFGKTIPLCQPISATGGEKKEALMDTFNRFKGTRKNAVTSMDIEKLVQATPGLIVEKVKAFPKCGDAHDSFGILVAVKQAGSRILSEEYRRCILRYLEPYRLLGCSIEIVSPRYARMDISIEAIIYPGNFGVEDDVFKSICRTIEASYSNFGATIVTSELARVVSNVRAVKQIIAFNIYLEEIYTQTIEKDKTILKQDVIVCLGKLDFITR